MMKLIIGMLSLLSNTTFAGDYTINSKNLESYQSVISDRHAASSLRNCYKYQVQIKLSSPDKTLATDVVDSGCDGQLLPNIIKSLNRIKNDRISMTQKQTDDGASFCYKTVAIFTDNNDLIFDEEYVKCP